MYRDFFVLAVLRGKKDIFIGKLFEFVCYYYIMSKKVVVSPLFFVTYGLLFWMIFFCYLFILTAWVNVHTSPWRQKYLPGFGSFMQVFCTTRKYKFCQSRPSKFLFQFFNKFPSYLNLFIFYRWIYNWSVSEYRIHSIQYFTLQFHFHLLILILILILCLYLYCICLYSILFTY